MSKPSIKELEQRILELESRLEESEQLIEAIKSGEVDAFAIQGDTESEIFTLQSGDYAYRVLVEEFGEGAINVTEEGIIVYTNTYFFELLQVSYEQVIGTPFLEFVHDDSKQQFNLLFDESLQGKSKGEINLCIDHRIVPVYISLTSLQPKLTTVGIIITDLSEKKKNEQIFIEYQNNLINNNLELVKRNAELASFAYIASHDLQEPLRKIQTFATLILEREAGNLTISGTDYFARMQVAAKRMQALIEDLLTYSRTNTGDLNFELTDVNTLLEEIKSDIKESLLQKQAVIEAGDLGQIALIPFQFRQLLFNLINNSLKFSKADEIPVIQLVAEISTGEKTGCSKLVPEKKYYHLRVSDNGIGFEQQYSEKIFELFQRLHGKMQYIGTGIGLAIVKKIVENHKGFISAKSEPNMGATFDIYIPVN